MYIYLGILYVYILCVLYTSELNELNIYHNKMREVQLGYIL